MGIPAGTNAEAKGALDAQETKLQKKRENVVKLMRGLSHDVNAAKDDDDDTTGDKLLGIDQRKLGGKDEEQKRQKEKDVKVGQIKDATDDEIKPFTDEKAKKDREAKRQGAKKLRGALDTQDNIDVGAGDKDQEKIDKEIQAQDSALKKIQGAVGGGLKLGDLRAEFDGSTIADGDIIKFVKDKTGIDLGDKANESLKNKVLAAAERYNDAQDARDKLETTATPTESEKRRREKGKKVMDKEMRKIIQEYAHEPDKARELMEGVIQRFIITEYQLRGIGADVDDIIDDYFKIQVPDPAGGTTPVDRALGVLEQYKVNLTRLDEIAGIVKDSTKKPELAELYVMDLIDKGDISPIDAFKKVEAMTGLFTATDLAALDKKIRQIHLTTGEVKRKGDLDIFVKTGATAPEILEYVKIYYGKFNPDTFVDDIDQIIKAEAHMTPAEATAYQDVLNNMIKEAGLYVAGKDKKYGVETLIDNIKVKFKDAAPRITDKLIDDMTAHYNLARLPDMFKKLGYAYADEQIDWNNLGIIANPGLTALLSFTPDGLIQKAIDAGEITALQADHLAFRLMDKKRFANKVIADKQNIIYGGGGTVEGVGFKGHAGRMDDAVGRALMELDTDRVMSDEEKAARRLQIEAQGDKINRRLEQAKMEKVFGWMEQWNLRMTEAGYKGMKRAAIIASGGGLLITIGTGTGAIVMLLSGNVGLAAILAGIGIGSGFGTSWALNKAHIYGDHQERYATMHGIELEMDALRKTAKANVERMSFAHALINTPGLDHMQVRVMMRDMGMNESDFDKLSRGDGLLGAQEALVDDTLTKIKAKRDERRSLKNQKVAA